MILRTMLIQTISETDIKLNSMETNEKGNDNVEIVIDISLEEKTEEDIEHVITRFTMEPGVYYLGYKKKKPDIDDDDEN